MSEQLKRRSCLSWSTKKRCRWLVGEFCPPDCDSYERHQHRKREPMLKKRVKGKTVYYRPKKRKK